MMKVLVAFAGDAERDSIIRLVSDAGFEAIPAADGNAAVRSALTILEPYLALLDRNLPELSGLQVCLCMRSPKLKVRPYIVVISDASEATETPKVLDLGADEHVSKPLVPVEFLARLKAASRTLQHQLELQQRVAELETLAKRYGLLGEIVANTGHGRTHKPGPTIERPRSPDPKDSEQPPPKAAVIPQPVRPKGPPEIPISLAEADEIMQHTIRELRFGNVGVIAKVVGDCYAPSHLTTWAGFLVEDQQVWCDLLLEVDKAAMAMIFEQTMGRPPESEQERKEFLIETHTIVSASFKSVLTNRGARILAPILSQAIPAQNLTIPHASVCESIRYVLAGGSIAFTIVRHSAPLKRKTVLTLNRFDITAEDIPPAKHNEVPWLSKGSVLTPRFISKLAALDTRRGDRLIVPVFPCSPIAASFLGESGARAEDAIASMV